MQDNSTGHQALDFVSIDELRDALRDRPTEVDEALKASGPTNTSIGISALQALLGGSAEPVFSEKLHQYLTMLNQIGQFTSIYRGRRGAAEDALARVNASTPINVGQAFYATTARARCRIHRNGAFQGSGCVVGPSLALTCAHVLGDQDEDSFPKVELVLDSSQRVSVYPRPVAIARPADADSTTPLDGNDTVYKENDDFALLRMQIPMGAHGPTVRLPDPPEWQPSIGAAIDILHFPDGEDTGVGRAKLESFQNPTTRWSYTDAPTEPGSSGGACFNSMGQIVGIHQGAIANGKRMVPLSRFWKRIRDPIIEDLAPIAIWSLDDRLSGNLVIGRDDLFMAFRILANPAAQQRGLRVRRGTDGTIDGLGYTVEILHRLIARRPDSHRAFIISWPQATMDNFDLIDNMARRAADELLVDASVALAQDGIAPGETGEATVSLARAEQLVGALHESAEKAGRILWLIFEHSQVELGEQVTQLETLAALALRWPMLRLVIVGNETVRLPDAEYSLSDINAGVGGPGLLVEQLGLFNRQHVLNFIKRACETWTGEEPVPAEANLLANQALAGIPANGNSYPAAHLPQVAARLKERMSHMEPVL